MVTPIPRVFPKCPKCEGQNFSAHSSTFKKVAVIIIYCDSCGAVLGVANSNEKQKT